MAEPAELTENQKTWNQLRRPEPAGQCWCAYSWPRRTRGGNDAIGGIVNS